jgi:hypothetical protein
MLKRNIIAIAIVTLGLVMAINTFGQERGKRPSKTNPEIKRSDAIIKPIQAEVNEIMIDGTKVWGNEVKITGGKSGNSETSRMSKSNTQSKLGNSEPQNISETGVLLDLKTPPRDTTSGLATGRRQYEPVKRQNLGDTGTHEVGHKQRKRRN